MYDEDIPGKMAHDVLRMRLFDEGHSLQEIDSLSFHDLGLIVGYKSGKQKGDEKTLARNKRLKEGATDK